MIGRLSGKIMIKTPIGVILDVAGVGYIIKTTDSALNSVNIHDKIALWTHTHVRENILELYGFFERDEMLFFENLISVSGIGPRSALSILNLAPIQELQNGIIKGDANYLTKISGIGKKTAEKIVIELRDKIGKITTDLNDNSTVDGDVIDALKALGYSTQEARDAVRSIAPTTTHTNERVKEALKILGR